MTDEETKIVVSSEVKSHFAPKQLLPPKEKIPTKTVEHFVNFLERPPAHVENRPSDYDHSIRNRDENDRKRSVTILSIRKRLPRFSVFSVTIGNSPGFTIKVLIGDYITMLMEIRKSNFKYGNAR